MSETHTLYDGFTVTKNDDSTVTITGELPFEHMEKHRGNAVKKLSEHVSIDGFRKGHIPEDVLKKHVGDMAILEEMARDTIAAHYPQLILAKNVQVIGRPEISITKIGAGSPLGFSVTAAVMPEIILPDYKEAAKEVNGKKEEVTVSDTEVEETIQQILKQRAAEADMADAEDRGSAEEESAETSSSKEGEGGKEEEGDKDKSGAQSTKKDDTPIELTDEIAKGLGNFKDADDFKKQLKDNMLHEKTHREAQKHRGVIMDAILKDTKVSVPTVMVEGELDRMMAQFEDDIARMGLKFDEYLKHIKKEREDLRKEWHPDAEKRAKTQLILNKIAVTENIQPDAKRLEEETKALLEQYKDAGEENVRVYVETILTNDAVFAFLEGLK
jgi:trigger factor